MGPAAAVLRAASSLSASDHRLGHFLDEQRDTVGALDDLSHHIRRHLLAADQTCNDGGYFVLASRLSVQARDMRLSGPGRAELGTETSR